MTWTYDSDPGTSTAAQRRDAVRLLIGDTDTTDQKLQDEEIAFALSQAGDEIYTAAAICSRSIAAKYAKLTDTQFETVSDKFSQRQKHYMDLANRLEKQARIYGAKALGVPLMGGVSKDDVAAVDDLTDRVEPVFKQDQYENP